jgi:hypothetical protein
MQHKSHQTVINGVMVASNQRGYFMAPPEKAGFYPEFVVTIDRTYHLLPAHPRRVHITNKKQT